MRTLIELSANDDMILNLLPFYCIRRHFIFIPLWIRCRLLSLSPSLCVCKIGNVAYACGRIFMVSIVVWCLPNRRPSPSVIRSFFTLIDSLLNWLLMASGTMSTKIKCITLLLLWLILSLSLSLPSILTWHCLVFHHYYDKWTIFSFITDQNWDKLMGNEFVVFIFMFFFFLRFHPSRSCPFYFCFISFYSGHWGDFINVYAMSMPFGIFLTHKINV